MQSISDRLRIIRKELNLTQNAFCELIGENQGNYSKIETDKRTLSKKALEYIVKELGYSFDWLMYGEGEKKKSLSQEIQDLKNSISRLQETMEEVKSLLTNQGKL